MDKKTKYNLFNLFVMQVGPAEWCHPLSRTSVGESVAGTGKHEGPVRCCQWNPQSGLCGMLNLHLRPPTIANVWGVLILVQYFYVCSRDQ